jgi:hypothetical protein
MGFSSATSRRQIVRPPSASRADAQSLLSALSAPRSGPRRCRKTKEVGVECRFLGPDVPVVPDVPDVPSPKLDDVADREVPPSRFTGCHFNRRERAPAGGEPARAHGAGDLRDAAVARRKDHVDGEAHAERVHRAAGRDDERRARRQSVAPEESAPASPRVPGDLHRLGKRAARARDDQTRRRQCGRSGFRGDRVKKMARGHGRGV